MFHYCGAICLIIFILQYSVGAYVANTNSRRQLMLIFGTMHNLEVYAIMIQKMMVPFLKINFHTILAGLNIAHDRPLDLFFETDTYYQIDITKTYACRLSYESSSCVENAIAKKRSVHN